MQQREVKKLPTLRGKTVVNLFFEDSTRTRISFEAAAKRLSRRRHQLPREGLERLEGREPARTRRRRCRRWARTASSSATARPGAPRTLADERLDRRRRRQRRRRHARAPDAGAARRVHDPQAAARRGVARPRPRRRARHDRRRHPALAGRPVERVAARRPSAREVTLVAPPTLVPVDIAAWPARVGYDLDAAHRRRRPTS